MAPESPEEATLGMENVRLEPDPVLPQDERVSSGRTVTDIISYIDEDGRTYHGWMAGGKPQLTYRRHVTV